MSLLTLLIFFVILLGLVLVHEAGHFFAAKISKMRVDEFAFGFPPKLFGIKKGETEYNFNALPLGGYVKIHGENGQEGNDPDAQRSFSSRPWWQQIFVLSAGVLMNLVFAVVLFTIVFMAGTPMPKDSSFASAKYISDSKNIVTYVAAESPASQAGIFSGAQIISLAAGGEQLYENISSVSVPEFISKHQNETITFNVIQNGTKQQVDVAPAYNEELNKKVVGIGTSDMGIYKAPFHAAFLSGTVATYQFTKLTFIGFYELIKSLFSGEAKKATESLAGPVGIVTLVGDAQKEGLAAVLSFAAFISINLAVLNILPLPALDGGRIVFVAYEAVSGKKLSLNFQAALNGISFLLLIILMIYVTFKDVAKLL